MLRVPPASAADALAYFTSQLAFRTDVSDVHAALESGDPGFTLVDTRGRAAWDQGRVPQAIHLPTDDIAAVAPDLVDRGKPVVVYCWGPGCNGALRAAAAFARAGYQVKEMLGGMEYWIREGLPVATDGGSHGEAREPSIRITAREPDPLTVPAAGVSCAC